MIRFSCSKCQKLLEAEDKSAGRTVTCPGCGHHLVIPPAARQSAELEESNDNELPERPVQARRSRKRLRWARGFSKYPVARIVIILMRIVAVLAAIAIP